MRKMHGEVRGTLREVRGTLGEVRVGLQGDLGRVGGPSMRSGTDRGNLWEVRDWSGDP